MAFLQPQREEKHGKRAETARRDGLRRQDVPGEGLRQAAGQVGGRVLRPPVLARRRQPLPVRPSGAQGGVRGGLRGLQEVHVARGVVRRHRDRADGKGNSKDQGGGRKDEEGPRRKRPGGLTPAAKLKNRHQPGCGRASFFLMRQP